MVSLCHTLDNGQNALLELPTPGKSGSLFLFSQDMKYILKTIPKMEAKLLRALLPAYYKVQFILFFFFWHILNQIFLYLACHGK